MPDKEGHPDLTPRAGDELPDNYGEPPLMFSIPPATQESLLPPPITFKDTLDNIELSPEQEEARLEELQALTSEQKARLIPHIETLEAENEALRHQIAIDRLTRTYTRREFYDRMKELTQEIGENNQEDLFLVFLDFDDFGALNKIYGQLAGDKVLAKSLLSVLDSLITEKRGWDPVGRFGGEEFGVLLRVKKGDKQKAHELIETIRTAINSQTIATDEGKPISISASLGMMQYQQGMKIAELVNAADEAHNVAKLLGKDASVTIDGDRHIIHVGTQEEYYYDKENKLLINTTTDTAYPIGTGENGKPKLDKENAIYNFSVTKQQQRDVEEITKSITGSYNK